MTKPTLLLDIFRSYAGKTGNFQHVCMYVCMSANFCHTI